MSGSNENGAMRLKPLLAAALSGVLLAACGGGTGDPPAPPAPAPAPAPTPPPPPPPPPAAPLKLMPAYVNLNVDATVALSAFNAGGPVTWSSSDPTVATIDAAGQVTAVARGSAVITATVGSGSSAVSSTAGVRVWQPSGPNADPSAESLIEAAQTAGRISTEQALVYRVYARFGDTRLPAEFQGPTDPTTAIALRHVSAQLPQLSAATRDLLLPFLLPPIYAQSWFAQQFGAGSASTTAQQVRRLATSVNCSFAAYPLPVARRATAHFNLHAIVADQFSGEELMLDYIASVIEQIYAAQTGLLARFPKNDLAEGCNGGDGALDIYLSASLGNEDWGTTVTYPDRCEDTPAYIVINKSKFPPWNGLDAGQLDAQKRLLRTVLAHELLHAIQFGMDRSAGCADYDWIDEATAQWVSDHVFPSDNQEDGLRKLGLAGALRTGVEYVNYLRSGHAQPLERSSYPAYIYFQFVARKYGAPAIKALFDAWTGQGSVASLDTALQAVGANSRDAWAEFGKALWNDVRDNVLTDLRGWDGYDYGMANVAQANPLALDGGRTTLTLLRANGGSLAPRSVAYERLVFRDETSPVLLSNPLGSLPQAQHLKLTAVKKIGGQWRAPEDWTAEPIKYFCRDKVAERVEELLLIVSNGDPDPNAAPVAMPAGTPFELSASNVGCWKWQGSATRQISSDDGIQRGDNTARAVDLVFEPQIEGDGGLLFLTPTAGTASGLFTLESSVPPCTVTLTGPAKAVSATDGALIFNLDLKTGTTPPDRRVGTLTGTTFIDSTQVAVCNGQTTVTPAPSTGWAWLLYPVTTNPLDVSADGKTITASLIQAVPNARTVHNFSFTAMRE